MTESNYKDGFKHGTWKSYGKQGKLEFEAVYDMGKRVK
jgi:antitoxin component YwqK of YwqJK toxin-antitoxin module